jgi:hypothetical protein
VEVQHAQREEERVHALLLQRELRLVRDAPERVVQPLGGERGLQPVVGVAGGRGAVLRRRLLRERGERRRLVRVVLVEVGLRSAGGRRRGVVRDRPEAHGAALQVELPERLDRQLVHHGDGRDPRRLEVEQTVALREVQELPLPVLHVLLDARGALVAAGQGGGVLHALPSLR